MFGHNLEHDQFRKHVSIFGNIFNGIKVYRRDPAGARIQTLSVPIEYGERSKFLTRVIKDPSFLSQAVILPRISFEITGIQRDPKRQQAPLNRRLLRSASDENRLITEREPTAYVINFEMSIYTKTAYDQFQIVESILPYFQPSMHVSVKNIAERMDVLDDIRITLDSSRKATEYEGSFEERQIVVWVMAFTMYTQFHPHVSEAGLINKVIVNFVNSTTEDWQAGDVEQLTITPGLTATGQPTSDPDETIHYTLIKPSDDFGYVETWKFFKATGETLTSIDVQTSTPDPIAANPSQQLHFHLEGLTGYLEAGQKAYVLVPRDVVIKNWYALGDAIGSAVVDVRAAPFGTTITAAHSITGGEKIVLVNQLNNFDTKLSAWSPHLNESYLVEFYVESVSDLTRLDIWIEVL